MRRVVRFLVRLYPANWRERYGEEFEALLEDAPPGWAGIQGLISIRKIAPEYRWKT